MQIFIYFLHLLWLIVPYDKSVDASCKPDFIAIQHTGIEERHIRTILISQSMPDVAYVDKIINHRNHINIDNKLLMISEYEYVKVNYKSYLLIQKFVLSNPQLLTDKHNVNCGSCVEYRIFLCGKKYELVHEKKSIFFHELAKYLKNNNSNYNIINRINAI